MIDVVIDKLTNSIEEAATGNVFDTEVCRLTASELKKSRVDWQFDWMAELSGSQVFKLTVAEHGPHIHGLISLTAEDDHIFVRLVENHPSNIGRQKKYVGVAANLFAYAAKMAFDLGHEGFVSFVAKSELIRHYQQTLGATQLGSSQRMFLNTKAARFLVARYLGDK